MNKRLKYILLFLIVSSIATAQNIRKIKITDTIDTLSLYQALGLKFQSDSLFKQRKIDFRFSALGFSKFSVNVKDYGDYGNTNFRYEVGIDLYNKNSDSEYQTFLLSTMSYRGFFFAFSEDAYEPNVTALTFEYSKNNIINNFHFGYGANISYYKSTYYDDFFDLLLRNGDKYSFVALGPSFNAGYRLGRFGDFGFNFNPTIFSTGVNKFGLDYQISFSLQTKITLRGRKIYY